MTQLQKLRNLLKERNDNDPILEYFLDISKDIICDIRNTRLVEPQYKNLQIQIAIELYNKQGAEGQLAHSENGISRTYSNADVSDSLLSKITPMVKTPFSKVRVM